MSTTSILETPALSERAERGFRVVATVSVIILACFAAVLSYAGLHELALNADIHRDIAWTFPIIVDGLTFVGSLGVIHAVLARMSAWYPWVLTLLGVAISITGNVAAAPADPISRLVHAAPPLILALSLEALLRVYRVRAVRQDRQGRQQPAPAPGPAVAPALVTTTAAPAPAPAPAKPAPTAPEPAPAPVEPSPAPAIPESTPARGAGIVTAENLRPSLPKKTSAPAKPAPAPLEATAKTTEATPAPGVAADAEKPAGPSSTPVQTAASPAAPHVPAGTAPAATEEPAAVATPVVVTDTFISPKVDAFAPPATRVSPAATTGPAPVTEKVAPNPTTAPARMGEPTSNAERVEAMVRENREISGGAIARALGIDPSYARQLRRKTLEKIALEEASGGPSAAVEVSDQPVLFA